MHSVTITTRTLPPTETKDKRVRVRTSDGAMAEYSWDHSYDGPEVHERAALKLVGDDYTVHRTGSHDMGYTFRAMKGM